MAKAKEKVYEFPLLEDAEIMSELAEILPPKSANQLSISDLKQPNAAKWQQFYIDILCMVFELQEEQLTVLSFAELNVLPNPDIQTEFMVYLRLSKCMSRLLYTCRYTEFKLPDITNPNPQRLRKILSAIINFCRHREEIISKSDEIEKEERDALSRCNHIASAIEETRSWINAKMADKMERSKVVEEKKQAIAACQKEMEELKESQIELDKEIHHLKLKALETQKSNADEKLRIANLREDIENLNKNIVPSPQKLHREIEEQKRKLETVGGELVDLEAKLENTKQIAAQLKEKHEGLTSVTLPLRGKVQEAVKVCQGSQNQVKQLNDVIIAKKDEYATITAKLQQLERLEANKVERAMKMDLAHSTKTRLMEKEKIDVEKEKLTLEKRLEDSNATLLTSQAPLLEIRQKQYQEQKVHEERMTTLGEKVEKVISSLRHLNEREIRRFTDND